MTEIRYKVKKLPPRRLFGGIALTNKFKRIFAAAFSLVIIGTYAEAAEITVSDSQIELEENQTEFSFDINIEEDTLLPAPNSG